MVASLLTREIAPALRGSALAQRLGALRRLRVDGEWDSAVHAVNSAQQELELSEARAARILGYHVTFFRVRVSVSDRL